MEKLSFAYVEKSSNYKRLQLKSQIAQFTSRSEVSLISDIFDLSLAEYQRPHCKQDELSSLPSSAILGTGHHTTGDPLH